MYVRFFFFNDTATTEIYTLSLHDALPICRPNADPLECGERGARVVQRLHVQDCGRATEQQLRRPEHRGPVERLLSVRRLERPDAPGEPLLEPQIVGETAKQGLAEMHMGLDQAG